VKGLHLHLFPITRVLRSGEILAVFIVVCGRRPKTGVLFDCYGLLPSRGKIARSWAAMSPGFFTGPGEKAGRCFPSLRQVPDFEPMGVNLLMMGS
jgi:hypothetical protein